MTIQLKITIPIALAISLTACGGGGGGGGGGTTSTLGSFTKFSAISPGVPTRIEGSSQEAQYTWNSTTNQVSISALSTFGSTATADFTLDASGNPTTISFTSAKGTSASFSTSAGDTIGVLIVDAGTGAAVTKAEDKFALFARSQFLGWDYQTYGIWFTDAGNGSGTAGSFSVGARTVPGAIPASGSATYTGSAGGFYVNSAGTHYFTIANMSAMTDFGNRTLSFSTTGTRQSTDLLNFSSNADLNMSGALSYASGANQFSGNISTLGGLTGTATGYFYGPAAQEIGGGFAASGAGGVYGGSFGGKR